ncbi:hypothetical protein Tco_0168859 [Tanacetum coccineum]
MLAVQTHFNTSSLIKAGSINTLLKHPKDIKDFILSLHQQSIQSLVNQKLIGDKLKSYIEDWVDSDDEVTDVSKIQIEHCFLAQKIVKYLLKQVTPRQSTLSMVKNLGQRNLGYPSQRKYFYPSAKDYKGRIGKYCQDQKYLQQYFHKVSTTRTPHRPQRPKKIVKSIWGKEKEGLLDSKEAIQKKISWTMLIIDSGCSGSMTETKTSCLILKSSKVVMWLLEMTLKLNVIFTDKGCVLILSPSFKVVMKTCELVVLCAPRKNDEDEECPMAQKDWGMSTSKNITSWFIGNLVRGLPSKTFQADHYVWHVERGKKEIGLSLKMLFRTMLADSLLPIQFWAEAVNTACYENQKGKGPDWMFDLELLTPSMNYIPVRKENYADSKEQGYLMKLRSLKDCKEKLLQFKLPRDEVYVKQAPGFEDLLILTRSTEVVKAIYGRESCPQISVTPSFFDSDYAGDNLDVDQLRRMSLSGKRLVFGMQRNKQFTSWEQFGTNIASALVGLATNQKFNFSLMILNGMLGNISNGSPHSTKFSCRITPLTPSMLEVVTALAEEEEHSTSPHSRAASLQMGMLKALQTQSLLISTYCLSTRVLLPSFGTATPHDSDAVQGTVTLNGTADIGSSRHRCFLGRESKLLKKQKRRRTKHRRKCLPSNWGGIWMKELCPESTIVVKQKNWDFGDNSKSTARQGTITPGPKFDDEAVDDKDARSCGVDDGGMRQNYFDTFVHLVDKLKLVTILTTLV